MGSSARPPGEEPRLWTDVFTFTEEQLEKLPKSDLKAIRAAARLLIASSLTQKNKKALETRLGPIANKAVVYMTKPQLKNQSQGMKARLLWRKHFPWGEIKKTKQLTTRALETHKTRTREEQYQKVADMVGSNLRTKGLLVELHLARTGSKGGVVGDIQRQLSALSSRKKASERAHRESLAPLIGKRDDLEEKSAHLKLKLVNTQSHKTIAQAALETACTAEEKAERDATAAAKEAGVPREELSAESLRSQLGRLEKEHESLEAQLGKAIKRKDSATAQNLSEKIATNIAKQRLTKKLLPQFEKLAEATSEREHVAGILANDMEQIARYDKKMPTLEREITIKQGEITASDQAHLEELNSYDADEATLRKDLQILDQFLTPVENDAGQIVDVREKPQMMAALTRYFEAYPPS